MNLHPSLLVRAGQALLLLGLVPLLSSFTECRGSATFSDNFEGTTLDPFWSKIEHAGSITFPSTTRAHTGRQSAEFNSITDGNQKNINLYHTFATAGYGRVSVWVYDSGADESSANYIGFFVRNAAAATATGLFTQDYDLGPSNGGGYYYNTPGGDSVLTTYDRTKAWHQFTITASPQSLELQVDSTVVYSGPGGFTFDYVTMEIHGPSWRPAWSVQFDDFEYVEIPVCPGPASFTDSFEGTQLDPFWSKLANSGSIIFPSTTRSHSGQQSVELDSTANTGQKNINLFHTFPAPVYGRVSVWVFDSGADESSANYIGFFVRNAASATAAGLFTQDYDLGPSNGGGYYYNAPGGDSVLTAYDRTKAWHQFIITASPQSLTLEVDSTTVYSGPGGFTFDYVTIEIHGPTWRPAWSVQFDDFSFTEFATPHICTQPASQMAAVGATVTFAVEAGGASPLTYQWQQNGTDLPGATQPALTLPNANLSQAGAYTVRVSSPYGSVTSLPAALSFFGLAALPELTIAGPVGAAYRVDYRTSVAGGGSWLTLTNITLPATPYRFIDWNASGAPGRFYRAVLVQ